jgi:hypothetical protein
MSVPSIVQSRLDGEQVAAQVSLGGEDGLYVTRTRTLIYRADGLLSDESVEEYPHEAERIEISEGRRKSAIQLDYGIEGEETFKIPSNRLYEALHPVLAGVLNAADVTGRDETVKQTYQFSELTLVITSERVVKHVGEAVWDRDYEEFHFDAVTELDVEEGSVSSQIIVETDGRPQRIKTPSDQTREVRERIERALLDHHEASSYEEFARERADPEDHSEAEGESDAETEIDNENDPLAGGGVAPIDADPPELDDDGAIVDDETSVTTDERPGGESADGGGLAETDGSADDDSVTAAEASDAAARAAAASASDAVSGERDESADSTAETRDGASGHEETSETDEPDSTGDSGADRDDETDASAASEMVADEGGFADSGFEPASSELGADDADEQLAALTEAVERQNELLAEQQRTLEALIEELSRGR